MAISEQFDTRRSEYFLDCLANGKPIESPPGGWSGKDMLALVDASCFGAMSQGAASFWLKENPEEISDENAEFHWLFEAEDYHVSTNDLFAAVSTQHAALFKTVGLYFQSHCGEIFIRRTGVVAALLATFDAAGAKAAEFWEPLITGFNLPQGTDPRFPLRQYL